MCIADTIKNGGSGGLPWRVRENIECKGKGKKVNAGRTHTAVIIVVVVCITLVCVWPRGGKECNDFKFQFARTTIFHFYSDSKIV